MKTRLFPTILVLASATSTYLSAEQHNWKECGEKWSTALNGSSHLTENKISKNVTLYGKVNLKDVNIGKNLTCYGMTTLAAVHVDGVTTMYGPMSASNCTFKDMDIRCSSEKAQGTVKLSHSSVDNLNIDGKLQASNATIKRLTTFSDSLTLSGSTVEGIAMMSKNKRAVIELNDTVVEGTIAFSKKGGTVICRGSSKVNGPIVGGTLKKVA